MAYRDENEALRARVSKLEAENAELRDKLEPKPVAPPIERPRAPSEATPRRRRLAVTARAVARAVLWASGVAAVLGGVLYVSCVSFRAVVWRAKTTFSCPVNGDATIRDKVIRVDEGPAIELETNCSLTLVRCDIRGRRGIRFSVNNRVVIEQSYIEGSDSALELGTNAEVLLRDSTVVGPITPLDARIAGLTDLPLARVLADPHAVAPLAPALIDRAAEMSRLGPGARLVRIDAVHVAADGSVDLDAPDYKGSVSYALELPVRAEVVEPPPVRPGLAPPPRPSPVRRVMKVIQIDAKGMRVATGVSDATAPSERVSAPRCSLAQIWQVARGEAPANAVAHVTFTAAGAGSWRFAIEGTEHVFDVSNDSCQRVSEQL